MSNGQHDEPWLSANLVVCIVRQVWGTMEEVADAMPAVGAHDLEPLHAHMVADDVSHLSIPHSWLHRVNRLLQRLQPKYDNLHVLSQCSCSSLLAPWLVLPIFAAASCQESSCRSLLALAK